MKKDIEFVKKHYQTAFISWNEGRKTYRGHLDDSYTPCIIEAASKEETWSKLRQFIIRYGKIIEPDKRHGDFIKRIQTTKSIKTFQNCLRNMNYGIVQFH